MSKPILKKNLTEGQRVWYFNPIYVSQTNIGERKLPMSKIKELSFKHIDQGGVVFKIVENDIVQGGRGVVLYNSIKGLLFHTEEEATKARDAQYLAGCLRVEAQLKEYVIEVQNRYKKLVATNIELLGA